MRGRHVGPFPCALGPVPATGRDFAIRITDILQLTDGRVSAVWMVSDESAALAQIGVLTPDSLTTPPARDG